MENNLYTSNFKDYWKVIISGTITFLCLNFILAYGMHFIDSQGETGRSISDGRYNKIDTDVIFLGDSRTHEGLDPAVFAEETMKNGGRLEALNLGSPGMQGPFYYYILKDYIDHAKTPPKVVIANISFYMLGGFQWFKDVYLAYYTPDLGQAIDLRKSGLQTTYETIEWYVRTRIPALRYNKSFSGLIDTFSKDPANGLPKLYYDNKAGITAINDISLRGYLSTGKKTVSKEEIEKLNYDDYKIGFEKGYSVYFDYFKKFFDLAKDNKIHVIIYPFPWPEKAKSSKNFNMVHDYYERMIKDLAKGNEYVHFVDYDKFWSIDNFANPLHTNQKGAERLTKLSVGWMKSVGIFPLHK